MRLLPTLFSLLFLISSCISTEEMKLKNTSEMLKISKSEIDGSYSNQISGLNYCNNFGLWEILNRSYSGKLKFGCALDSSIVKLKLINENMLSVILLDKNEMVLDEFNLKGKLEHEYFSVKRKCFLIPIPAFFRHYETKNLLGISKDGNLVVMHGYADETWILIIAGGVGGISHFQFNKENK